MMSFRICHVRDQKSWSSLTDDFHAAFPNLRLRVSEISGENTVLHTDHGGMKVYWLYSGEGEVFLPKGYRTKEGDGHPLPAEYEPDPVSAEFAEVLASLGAHVDDVVPAARGPLLDILSRQRRNAYVGDCANDLWKLEHVARPWSESAHVVDRIEYLFGVYREHGFSTKTADSFEYIMEGDQLIVAGDEEVPVRGTFGCLSLEHTGRRTSHIPTCMRLRYLRDSSGGGNVDFDPFRRLPLTWYMNLPSETGDGVNVMNSHVVNIARETSPTHFHPRVSVGGGDPQHEMYLVLNPKAYELDTYGRAASLVTYPDLQDFHHYEMYALEPGFFVFVPAGTAHRGLDVFANVITVPGFKPHNEYYVDQDILDTTHGATPHNPDLIDLKNYERLDELI